MSEYAAKKLGEVLAFAQVGAETIERGRSGLEKVFLSEDIDNAKTESERHATEVEKIASQQGVEEAVSTKAEKTGGKLRHMRDFYVGDEWDDPAELLEWSGFFEGAAIVHWGLVEGVAEEKEIEELKKLCEGAINFHEKLLKTAREELKKIGEKK